MTKIKVSHIQGVFAHEFTTSLTIEECVEFLKINPWIYIPNIPFGLRAALIEKISIPDSEITLLTSNYQIPDISDCSVSILKNGACAIVYPKMINVIALRLEKVKK